MGSRTDRAKNLTARVLTADGDTPFVRIEFSIANELPLRVIRRRTGFVFSLDNMGYFCGMTPDGGEVIFEGIPERGGSFVTIDDIAVEVGVTYAYFVISDENRNAFAGPAAVKVRDPYIFRSHERILEKTEALARDFGGRVVEMGETVGHKRLAALVLGNPERSVSLIGAVHAGEAGAELCLSVAENILRTRPELLDKVGLTVLPSVNADERERVVEGHPAYLRQNRNAIDINRNFDAHWETVGTSYGVSTDDPRASTYRGPYPTSEPETRAVVRLMEETHPEVAISYHHVSSITGDSMYVARSAAEDTDFNERAERVSLAYKQGFRAPLGYPMNRVLFHSGSAGGFPTYCYERGIIGFDVEHWASDLPMFNESRGDEPTREMLDLCVECHTSALVSLLENM